MTNTANRTLTRNTAATPPRRQFLQNSLKASTIASLSQHSNLLKLVGISTGLSSSFLGNSALAQSTQSSEEKKPPLIAAPELRVPHWIDGQGKPMPAFTLANNTGKWVFLKCFQNWCPGCHSSGFPTLQKLVDAFGTDHAHISFAAIQTTFEGHYTNNESALRPLQLRYETFIPFGHDAGNPDLDRSDPKHFPNTMFDYKTRGTPWLIIITPDRQIAYANYHVNPDALIDYFKSAFSA